MRFLANDNPSRYPRNWPRYRVRRPCLPHSYSLFHMEGACTLSANDDSARHLLEGMTGTSLRVLPSRRGHHPPVARVLVPLGFAPWALTAGSSPVLSHRSNSAIADETS